MADNTLTGSTGVPIKSKDRAGVQVQEFLDLAAASVTIGYYTVTTTPTMWVVVNAGRRRIILQNRSSVSVFSGTGAVIDTATAPFIASSDTWDHDCVAGLYLSVASGTAIVSFVEYVN